MAYVDAGSRSSAIRSATLGLATGLLVVAASVAPGWLWSSEFAGYDDYRMLRERCRVLMLDDAFHAYKCTQAHAELERDPRWSCVWSSIFVRNGASIWLRTG